MKLAKTVKIPTKKKVMKFKSTETGTVEQFIQTCWKILKKAKKEGCSLRDLYDISANADCPPCTLATFQTTFFKVQKARRVLVERL